MTPIQNKKNMNTVRMILNSTYILLTIDHVLLENYTTVWNYEDQNWETKNICTFSSVTIRIPTTKCK